MRKYEASPLEFGEELIDTINSTTRASKTLRENKQNTYKQFLYTYRASSNRCYEHWKSKLSEDKQIEIVGRYYTVNYWIFFLYIRTYGK